MSVLRFPGLIDGEEPARQKLTLRLGAPALLCGAGIYETLLVLHGRAPLAARHVRRLLQSAQAFAFGGLPSTELLLEEVNEIAAQCPGGDALLRLMLLRDTDRMRRVITTAALPKDRMTPVRLGMANPPFDGPRTLAVHKTMNALQAQCAHREGMTRGCDEVLLSLPDGTLLEGSRSSLFLVRDGVLCTPAAGLPILPGITREVLLELAGQQGVRCSEGRFTAEDLRNCDEAFISASVRGLRAVRSFEGTPLRGCDGPITTQLRAAFDAVFS